ncbi:hypothetical protein [Catellatospora sp. NPDC049609]|uniref:hypothetical protein n=1 Tax=Catellatospora sp. NPDC049609 TaxID=3155505 RepID=UPI0034370A97
MSEELMVRLVVTGFAISVVVRCWFAARQPDPDVAARAARVRSAARRRRRSMSRMIALGRARAAAYPAARLRRFRPASPSIEHVGRRLAAGLSRRQAFAPLGRRQPAVGGFPRGSAARLRPIL